MTRIFLPLAIIAALFLGPLFSETTTGSLTGERVDQITGEYFIGDTLRCWAAQNVSISGDCEPKGELTGKMFAGTAAVAGIAAVLGIIGMLPVIGRLTSMVTTLSGGVTMAAMGQFAMNMLGQEGGLANLEWGAYLVGGLGMLTLISGLSGMRGR